MATATPWRLYETARGYERKNDLGYAMLIGAIFILSVLAAVIEFGESQDGALAERAAAWSAAKICMNLVEATWEKCDAHRAA